MKLTKAQAAALNEVLRYSEQRCRYYWKLATMRKLEEAGLVWRVNDEAGGYSITDAGRKALKEMGE